jgi:hypothetical protein
MKPRRLDKPSVQAGIGLTAGPLLRCVDIDEDAPELPLVVGVRERRSEHSVAEQSHRKHKRRACPAARLLPAVCHCHPRLLQSPAPDSGVSLRQRGSAPSRNRVEASIIGNPPSQSNMFGTIERNRG